MVHSPSPTDLLQPPASSLQLGAVRRNNKTARLPQSAVPVIHSATQLNAHISVVHLAMHASTATATAMASPSGRAVFTLTVHTNHVHQKVPRRRTKLR